MLLNKTIILLMLVCFTTSAFAQFDRNYAIYERKVETYTKLKKTGTALTVAGAALTVGGLVLISSADWETQTGPAGQTQTTSSDSEGIAGVLMLVAGIPITVTGAILGTIGAKKSRQYQEKLQRLSLNVKYNQHYKGLVLAYRF